MENGIACHGNPDKQKIFFLLPKVSADPIPSFQVFQTHLLKVTESCLRRQWLKETKYHFFRGKFYNHSQLLFAALIISCARLGDSGARWKIWKKISFNISSFFKLKFTCAVNFFGNFSIATAGIGGSFQFTQSTTDTSYSIQSIGWVGNRVWIIGSLDAG